MRIRLIGEESPTTSIWEDKSIESFDLSVADIYLPLLTRSKHYILEVETQKKFQLLFKELKNSNAGLAVMTPSFADLLMVDKSFNKELMPSLKKILFCGEKLSRKTVTKLNSRFDNLAVSVNSLDCDADKPIIHTFLLILHAF